MGEIDLLEYPNLLDSIDLSDMDVLGQISEYKLDFPQIRNEKVEWQTELPMFVTPFYTYLVLHNRVPSQEEFWNFYQIENASFFMTSNFGPEITEAIKCRVFRTYPSLVRDIHFALFLKKRLSNCKIVYNTKLDIEEGIDLLVVNGNDKSAINCFTETEIAWKGRTKKQHKHQSFKNVNYIDLPVIVKGAKSWGDFYLYGLVEFNKINNIIKQK